MADVIDATERGRSFTDQSQAPTSGFDAECVRIVQAINKGIEKANKKAISGAQRVQKWTILPTDFSLQGGELGN